MISFLSSILGGHNPQIKNATLDSIKSSQPIQLEDGDINDKPIKEEALVVGMMDGAVIVEEDGKGLGSEGVDQLVVERFVVKQVGSGDGVEKTNRPFIRIGQLKNDESSRVVVGDGGSDIVKPVLIAQGVMESEIKENLGRKENEKDGEWFGGFLVLFPTTENFID